MTKRRSYNPFTMWGTYAGAAGVFIALWLAVGILSSGFGGSFGTPWEIVKYAEPVPLLTGIGIGSAVGWIIHSAFRRFAT